MGRPIYYFAYGSCMNLQDLQKTTAAEFVSAATLFDYKLAFTRYSSGRKGGVADIVPSAGDYVEGVLFKVKDLQALDRREGAPFAYQRKRFDVMIHKFQTIGRVWSYEVVNKEPFEIKPSEAYKKLIREGAKQFLSREYQKELESNLKQFRAPYDLTAELEACDIRRKSLMERLWH